MLLLPVLLLAPLSAHAGDLTIAHRDLAFDDDTAGEVAFTVHYPATHDVDNAPADLSAGPYPLVVFLHGYLGAAWMYADTCDHLASEGFVVVNMNTETGGWLDMGRFADDAYAALHHVDTLTRTSDSWLEGATTDDPWTAMGHSMGGATLGKLVGLEPRIEQLVAFMPYQGDAGDYDHTAAFQGSALYITATHDGTALPYMVEDWFSSFRNAERALFFNIDEGGHQAVSDFEWAEEPMDDRAQRGIVKDLMTDFLMAEIHGEEDRYATLLGSPPGAMTSVRSRSQRPVLWAAGSLDVGVAGRPGSAATVYVGSGPGVTTTATHTVDLADAVPLTASVLDGGYSVSPAALPDGFDDHAWLQVVVEKNDETSHSRTLDLLGTGEPVGCGCSGSATGSGGVAWAWGVLPLLAIRRRRA